MMYIIFNHDGSIKEKNLNEFIQQGDNLTKKIAVAIIGYEPLAFSLIGTFKLPNGDTEVLTSDESIEIQGLPGVVLSLTEDITSLAGIVRMNIQAVNTSDVVLVSYSAYLTINEGDNPGTVAMMSIEQYQYLISQIEGYVQNEDCILKVDHRLTSTEGFEEGQVIYVKNESLNQLEELQNDEWVVIFDFTQVYTKTEIQSIVATLNVAISQKSTVSGTTDSNGKWNTLTIDGITHEVGGSGANYQAGTGISIVGDTISVDEEVVTTQEDLQNVREVAEGKCRTLVLNYGTTTLISSFKDFEGNVHPSSEFSSYVSGYLPGNSLFNSNNNYISPIGTSTSWLGDKYYFIFESLGNDYDFPVGVKTVVKAEELYSFLRNGDIILVTETNVPDRWYLKSSGQGVCHKLETSKIDLTNYPTFANLNTILGGILCGNYNAASTYALNDIVIYDNKLYKCTTEIETAEAWNSAHWTQIYAKDYFVDLYHDQYISGKKWFTNTTTISFLVCNNIKVGSELVITAGDGSGFTIKPDVDNLNSLGYSSYRWKDLYLSRYLSDGSNSYTIAEAMAQFNPNAAGSTEIKWTKMLTFGLSSSTTLTLETSKAGCLCEHKGIITNIGNSAITLTFTGVDHILCNDDNITIASNTLTLPSGTSIEINCLNGNMVAINFAVI